MNASINIQDQKIITGDHHVVYGDHANVNSGVQKDTIIHSLNSDSYNSSTTVGDIKNSSIYSSTIGSHNQQEILYSSDYDWETISYGLKTVISSIKGDDAVKKASQKALLAAEAKDKEQFNSVVNKHKNEFLSTLFNNTASGVLVQIISTIVGIS